MRMMFEQVHHSFRLLRRIAQKLVYFTPCLTVVSVYPENLLIKSGGEIAIENNFLVLLWLNQFF